MAISYLRTSAVRPGRRIILLFGVGAVSGFIYRTTRPRERKDDSLNRTSFTPFTLVSKDAVSSSSTIFTLRAQKASAATAERVAAAHKAGLWSVQFKQPQLQIARNYTPIPFESSAIDGDETQSEQSTLRFLVRREEGGEVSNYLHDLPERSTVSLRGPFQELPLPDDVTDVLFLAGGTGIAPALQIAAMLERREGLRMRILWANRKREDCVGGYNAGDHDSRTEQVGWKKWLNMTAKGAGHFTPDGTKPKGLTVRLLEELKARGNGDQLGVEYYVDEENRLIDPTHLVKIAAELGQQREAGQPQKKLILLSGPDGFIEYWAGRKQWRDGQEVQGPLRGELAKMNLRGWQVIKL